MATVDVHVVTPEREVWAGPARMVVARGVEGELGVLAGHAPLLVRLAVAPLRIEREDGSWDAMVVDGGFLHVTSGEDGTRVDVLANGADLAADVDRDAARARVGALEAQVAEAPDDGGLGQELAQARARANLPA
ncbi:MAG TPA: ATP synthase F1 subunit epsilon [Actinomycetota bacterium]|nr:ATP synthase F1 subunit epsilon [Actinomycetota bacterium]